MDHLLHRMYSEERPVINLSSILIRKIRMIGLHFPLLVHSSVPHPTDLLRINA
jgi:hypothetical protein